MSSRSFPPLFAFGILLLNFASVVGARTTPHKGPYKLILAPIDLASFILCILFFVIFALGALSASGKLGNEGKPLPSYRRGETYSTGRPYFFFLLLAYLCLIIYFALFAVAIVYALNQSRADVKPVSLAFSATMGAMLPLSQWFILCALLVLFFQRERVGRVGGSSRRYIYKFIVDLVLLGTHLSIIITSSSLQGTLQQHPTIQKVRQINQLGQAILGFQVILTFDVVVSAVWMWMTLKTKSTPDLVCIPPSPQSTNTPYIANDRS